MIFLVEYDRREGRVVSLREFEQSERRAAQDARLELELSLHRQQLDREVVLLEADGIGALKKTHGRYFALQRISLEDFLKLSPLTLEAFAHAQRLRHGENPSEFPLQRDEQDWWREVAAYVQYAELEEVLMHRLTSSKPSDES